VPWNVRRTRPFATAVHPGVDPPWTEHINGNESGTDFNTAVAANSVKEVIALTKSRPGQLNYGTTGIGSPSHLGCAMFALMTGVKLVHVPYRGCRR